MKKKVTGLLLLFLFILSNTAFATNWVLAKDVGFGITDYIDSDNVAKSEDILLYWYELRERGVRKIWKVEENLTKHQYRFLEYYWFNGGKIYKQGTPPSSYTGDSPFMYTVNLALKYAKDGADIGPIPTP